MQEPQVSFIKRRVVLRTSSQARRGSSGLLARSPSNLPRLLNAPLTRCHHRIDLVPADVSANLCSKARDHGRGGFQSRMTRHRFLHSGDRGRRKRVPVPTTSHATSFRAKKFYKRLSSLSRLNVLQHQPRSSSPHGLSFSTSPSMDAERTLSKVVHIPLPVSA